MNLSAVPALCAIALLALPGAAGALDPDESQFTGWLHAITEMRGEPIRHESRPIANFSEKLARVNREINRVQYTQAFDAYWETPSEFKRYGGQCREYAVAKYARLYELGVADADMALTVVRIKATGEYHAVLVVRHGGAVYVLDNLRRTVQGAARLRDFEIVYFINRIGWSRRLETIS
jgi:predicted transglutaminase-like cysteine proteinase